jgi:phospholipid/cholesterol/gamma-HCH transport system substrate-binding protein
MNSRSALSNLGFDSRVVLGMVTTFAVCAAFLFVGSGKFARMRSGGGHEMSVVFADGQQLRYAGFMRSGSEVRIAGVAVGEVSRISHDPATGTATATLKLKDSAGPIYADARASIRWLTLLGANEYIALDRGTPSTGLLGSRAIPPSHTSTQVELEDVTSILQDRAQAGLRQMPRQLETALRDPQPLRRALSTLARVAPAAGAGLHALRGAQPDSDLQTLVSASSQALQALDTPTKQLREVVAGAAATLTTTGDHDDDLRSILATAPSSLRSTQVTLRQVDGTLTLLDPLLAKLQGPAPQVAPTLTALRPTVLRARALLNRAVPLFHSLRPTAVALERMGRPALALAQELTPALNRFNDKILPYLGEKDPVTRRSTAEMIGPAIAVYANAGGLVDDVGRAIRFPLSVGSSSLYAPCQTFLNNPDAAQQVACQSLQDALRTFFKYRPLDDAPGTEGGPPSDGNGGR